MYRDRSLLPAEAVRLAESARDRVAAPDADLLDVLAIAYASAGRRAEALRAAEAGGVGSFFAKRKLRKIPAQQSSLAWRTLIGKISAIADWRD